MDSTTTKESERNCVLCCQEYEIYALGKCDHPVCYRCSTKMRVLCDQKYCAVCREELDKVVFVKKLEAFSCLPYQQFHCEKKHDIYFSDEKIYAKYLLSPECPCCSGPKVFVNFTELEQHMRKQHELFCCKLCTKHLKIFSHERKWYNRKELARHRAHGDPDDTSHRGHPLCKFCDDRYLDNDELLKHLRRDHYYCHFCDADGSQEYYSDYQYLSEHFRECHYLCEEGRCATEQFTHAFRTEIDYKAHKAAAHSKNRAEARQNRQIDLQFNYAPRQQRRNEGCICFLFFPLGWHREEEDREVAAAMRASMAMHRQEDRGAVQERTATKHCREDRTAPKHCREERTVPKHCREERTVPKHCREERTVPKHSSAPLKEDDFPSLSAIAVTSPMTPAYSAQPKKTSFQEEDFPALVSKTRPLKPAASSNSAWSNHTPAAKPTTNPRPSSRPPPPSLSSASSAGPQPLSSSTSLASRRKKKVGDNGKAASARSPPYSDDEGGGLTQQEFRSVPTMLDISSLLTVKGSNNPPMSKASRKKKQQKNTATSPTPVSVSGVAQSGNSISVETVAQKENLPEKTWNKPSTLMPALTSGLVNGHPEKSPPTVKKADVAPCPNTDPAPQQEEEEFPALMSKKPPPGKAVFDTTFLKISSTLPPPPIPPGLGTAATKPPPGFTGIPLNSNVVEPASPVLSNNGYLVPDDFHQRNLELIMSIRKHLNDDESKFNEFKNYSAQFRQGVISAAQYHRSCKDLLGDNFNYIFNELLVLLPDTGKQQELLTAHGDCKALEKQSGTGGGKKNKNKKNAWQMPTSAANAAAELDCQVCPACRQVLAPKDFNSHKTLHMTDNEEFPSLLSISRIIS
uniref:RING-type E3 ubiquitin transferase n=1 Tax=Mola mola TaxID=94237 RepID=A0A3Q3VK64_MOLML